jgi:hypothetical protein
MEKLILPVIITIILVAAGFYMYNSGSGINSGVNTGTQHVSTKTSTFDYKGDVAPGSGQTLPTGN